MYIYSILEQPGLTKEREAPFSFVEMLFLLAALRYVVMFLPKVFTCFAWFSRWFKRNYDFVRASARLRNSALSRVVQIDACRAVRRKRFSTNRFQFAIECRKGVSNWTP